MTDAWNGVPEKPKQDFGRDIYEMIAGVGWRISWRDATPVPDDAWPIDILNKMIKAQIAAAYRAGQEDMRERLASWLMCGCDTLEQARVVAAATTDGPNSGARWRACHRSDCLALIAAEALETPIKEAPHE